MNDDMRSILGSFFQKQASTLGTLPSNTIPNPNGEMKAITNRSDVAYKGPLIPTNPSPKKVVERETEEITDMEQTNFQGSTVHIQPPVVPISEPDVSKTLPKPNIPYPSRLNDQKLRDKATNQMEKFFQIFQDFHFDITMLLKKLPEKLGDPGKFLIPCDFPGMDMTLELADRSITHPKGVTEDVFVKVGNIHFPTDFVLVDFKADPHVPLILGRSFLRIGRALIDVYGEEINLRVNDESVTFNLNRTTRYSSTYDDMSVNRIDIIDVASEEYAQEVLGFSKNSSGGNLIPNSEPIIFDSSPSLTQFEGSDFILEEIEAYHKDDSVSLEIDHADCDPKRDICLFEKLLKNDPFQLPPIDLKQEEAAKAKSSIEEPSELELKDLPSHLEYAYLEDFMVPFPSSRGNRYILVAVDYFSKSVEAKALPTNDARVVVKFLKSLFARFGTPKSIISDCGTHFCNDKFAKVMSKYEKLQLNELHDQAYKNSLIYKEKTKKLHDSKIKNRIFNVGDRVLLFNSRLKIFLGKLKTRWSGPFTITHVFPFGTIELSQPDGPNFKVNGHRVKHYFGGDIPSKVVPNLQTFPMDK
nr:reverse transcriptase domain-containing protein [Tanacetum cinerariifolium]